MNFQMAAIVGGAAFLLSSLAGLIGGVPFLDVLVRAFLWAVLGFGFSVGIEALLRSLLPDLFVRTEDETESPRDSEPGRVDITLDDEVGGVFEDVDEDEELPAPRSAKAAPEAPRVEPAEAPAAREPEPDDSEEMPEIGAFLDAFKPNASGDQGEDGAAPPEYAEYAPVEMQERRSAKEVTIDGEAQDPKILAKAIQTVMKRDGQGN